MKRWRPLIWLFVSVACFIAAFYFWRLGDKWAAEKPKAPAAPTASNAPAANANPSTPAKLRLEAKYSKPASTAPIVELNPTNHAVVKSTNAFPWRLSNTTQTVGELARNRHAILLENALIDTTVPGGVTIPDSLRSHGDPGAYIVQANGPVNDAFRARLEGAGATIVSYIPNNAYLVRASAAAAAILGQNATVTPWEPYYKVKSSLMQSALAGQGVAWANVAVFPDSPAFPNALAETKAALDQMGVSVISQSPSPFGTELAVRNVGSIADLAALPGVEEVEPTLPRVAANDLTRIIMSVATNVFSTTNYLGLSGSNVMVAVPDSWVPTNSTAGLASLINPDLVNIVFPPIVSSNGIADFDGHATHVGGIIASAGNYSPSNAVGSLPGANFCGKAPSSTLLALPALTPFFTDAELQQLTGTTNALISNNSWGYGVNDYNLAAASYDQAVRDSVPGQTGSQSVIYVFAAGNNGGGDDGGEGGSPNTISSPAVAKNVITVGASELPRNITNQVYQCDSCVDPSTPGACNTNQPWLGMTDSSNQVARFSSRGNVGIGIEGDFGRFKPDLIAPGTFVVSTRSLTWDTSAYYNPVTVDVQTYPDDTVTTNNPFNYSVFVPCDATQLTISATSISPLDVDLPIYVRPNDFARVPADFQGSNFVTIPSPTLSLTPVDTFWYYAISDPTNIPVTYTTTAAVTRTAELGDYFDVLRTNLNDQLWTTNPAAPGKVFYRYESGTSMAAPAVAGTLALMEDFFTNRWKYQPSPALMKALLINGARSINPMYDFQTKSSINFQGWGLVNLTNSLPANLTNSFGVPAPMFIADQDPTNALATGDSRTLFVKVDPSAQATPLRVTLVWTDPPGNPAAGIKLVNNLDLIVTNYDNPTNPIVFFGNDFDPGVVYSSPWNGDTNNIPSDNVNNVENVYIPGTLGTNYSVTVIGREVNVNAVTANPTGTVQDYALVIASDNGEITNALTLQSNPVIPAYGPNVTSLTNQFTQTPDITGSLLLGQHVGASSWLQGTDTLSLGSINQDNWGNNGQITLGVSNQWHFYVVTNTLASNGVPFPYAAFATFLPPNLSIPPVGVNATDPGAATRPEADIDLYVARGPFAYNLTNLDPTIIASCSNSLTRGGEELVVLSNAQPNEVFYVGVKSEDQEAAEYAFLAIFSQNPFSQMDANGIEYLRGLNVPTLIPDGSPSKPGIARTIAIGMQPTEIRRVVVTNFMEHENFGDLFGVLKHGQNQVVLNNHTFGNGSTNQEFIYEDNDEGDIPGSRHPDGPGSLQTFIGQQGAGVWMLTEEDNALFNTGRVDNIFIRLDPQQSTNGVIATIQPNSFFYDFIDVPPNATNMTVCVNFLNGSIGPVQLYLRYGEQPTTGFYDYTKVINPPGDCLTVSRADLPPLRPGRYYVGIFNPTAVAQTVRLNWTFGLDPNGVTPTPVPSTNAPTSLLEDAVTNSTIYISNPEKIVELNVGVVLKDPRVSDLDLTLITPNGERILLMENRGGLGTTNLGHLNVFTNFFGTFQSGGPATSTNIITPPITSGILIIDYQFFEIPDQIDVYDGPVDIFSSGYISQGGTFRIPYNLVNGNTLTIVMNKGNNPATGTAWEYTPRIVSEDFTYVTFTDDTNLTQIPIKYAIPPFDAGDTGTNFTFSDFELATNGEYFAPVTNLDGWVMTTNDVFVRSNYFGGTNLLSMATNEVSVVTDPMTASSGSNYLALAKGSISRVIPLTQGQKYQISYRYRGPGIAGWWRGEGDATDSADPETLGNNGSLIGRFNFPAGEVGQAFAMTDSGLAFQFAGTNTYVQVRQSPSLDVGQGSGFTVEGWINPTNITFQQPMVEWLASVPTNSTVNGQTNVNPVIVAGPFLNRANGHYYYMLGQTNWPTSELWANSLGGHLAEVDDANEQNWIYDTFAQFGGGTNYTLWIGLTNDITGTKFIYSTGVSNIVYTNWDIGQPTNCSAAHYVAILGPTNAHPGNWVMVDSNGVTCAGITNKPFGVVEVNNIQTNGVQFWISVTNSATPGNGRLYANIFGTNGVPHEFFSRPGLIQSNVYQHVALTYNTNTGFASFYLNGTNVGSTNLGVFVPKTGGDVLIGKDMSRVTNNFFWGEMDEMSIYSRYLSPAEISAIYRISATSSNRNIGKFDPEITPAFGLAEAQVSFGNTTNLLYGVNAGWQVQGFSLQAFSNSLPLNITGIEPGILLDSFSLFQAPPGNLYYLPEQPLNVLVNSNANGTGRLGDAGAWTLEIRDARTGAIATDAQLISWELQFILQTNTPVPLQLAPEAPGTNNVPPGEIAYFSVFVPSWASYATNVLVSSTAPVDLLFNQNAPPGTGAPGDFTFVNNNTTGSQTIWDVNPQSIPPLIPGQTYYLGVRNNGTVPAQVVVEVNFDLTTLSNGIPVTSLLDTNDLERPFVFNVTSNATEATFQLLKLVGNADLVLRKGLPLPNLLSADYGSFGGTNADETIYVLTNSLPVPLSAGPWYLDVVKRTPASDASASNTVSYTILAKELDAVPNVMPNVITLTNRVPVKFTAGSGAALTNFFKFSVTNLPLAAFTNLGIHFELFNQSGDGDLIVQTNAFPLSPPFLQSSRLPGNTAEIIFVRTNSAMTNLNADWYLGVPNNETNPISFTILAQIDTNGFAAFPTAEGSGASTRGGAFGNVYHVVSLNDSGPGTLRDAVTRSNETVVFDVYGTINLLSPLYITNSFMTIAGQTAPYTGVTVSGAPTYVRNAHDVILRYLRFRPTNSIDINGSFENPAGYVGATFYAPSTFGGWAVTAGSIDDQPDVGWTAADGHTSLDMNGTTPGTISRTVPTTPGKVYNLRFAYSANPAGGPNPRPLQVSWGGNLLGTIQAYTNGVTFANMNWIYTNFTVVGSGSDVLQFASTTGAQFGPALDAVSVTSAGGDSLQITNSANVVVDHVSAEYGGNDGISVLNSSNVTVQWSAAAESLNQTNASAGGSEVRYGSGDVTFHHNLYADNYSGNPTIGENVSLDFVNNVVFNWGLYSGLSTNDLVDNPGGLTNFLNCSANYYIAYTSSLFTNVAFWSGSTNTWIFQTNNFIDTNRNSIIDGANTSWGMFSNQFTEFSHPFDIPPTAPDETFIAYERVLDFSGDALFNRDPADRAIVQRARLQPANTNALNLLSGMCTWWKAESNANDSIGNNNGVFNGTVSYAPGEVGSAFNFNGSSYVQVPDGPAVRFTNVMSGDVWINLTNYSGFNEVFSKYAAASLNQDSYTLGIDPNTHQAYYILNNTTYSANVQVFTANPIPLNTWTHLAVVADGTSAKIYMNGVLSGSLPWTQGIYPGTSPFTIGCTLQESPTSFFKGQIDELSLYKRPLTDCEIMDIYLAGHKGKQYVLALATNAPVVTNTAPYSDLDQDGIPDFWEMTLPGENPTNFSANLDRDGDGYTDLEEYMNWLGVPHALTVTNTQVGVNLYALSGNTGNLLFGVANGTNGTVYLTNSLACFNPNLAIFTPTNNFGNGTNCGFASFSYMVTNTDTMAYIGPITVSVFVSAVPITNIAPSTNIIVFTNPPPDQVTNELTLLTVTNGAVDSNTNLVLTYSISMTVDTNGMIANGWPLNTISLSPSPTVDPNTGTITWTPSEAQGPGVYIIQEVATDNGVPQARAVDTFRVIVNEVNTAPFWPTNVPSQTNYTVPVGGTLTVTNTAADSDIPINPLSYMVLNPPPGASIDTNGIFTWIVPPAQPPGVYYITNVVTDTNAYALFNNSLSATNYFTVTVLAPIPPFAFTQPAQAVTGPTAQLNGMATPNGIPSVAWFEWGSSTNYGNQTPAVDVGSSFNVVYTNATISGLTMNVPYHFRLVASNAFGVTKGFDQILDQAKVAVWGADYLKQAEVPPGLNNVTAIAAAYAHSMALKNDGSVVAWGDNTSGQTNVPPGLNSVLAIAGGQDFSMALKSSGKVVAWGGSGIPIVTNVPASLNNVVMIAGGTYASLALQSSGKVVSWGQNVFNVTNVPPGLNNVVEVSGGGYHSLAIRNNGTIVAWGDNSAGQTNIPPSATNIVAISGGGYHSLALRSDGTVVAWGDDSDGQTDVPAGLSNVVAIAAGGFHSLALKSDGTVVGWGDDTAGQSLTPSGLSNVVAVSAGYLHSMALAPTLPSIAPILLTATNGTPQTNSVLGGGIIFYKVNVPTNVDAATNTLLFTVNGPLNIWYTTNTPPSVGSINDFELMTNSVNGTSLVATATSPQLVPGSTYYLGVQNTNNFSVSFAIEVDFHFIGTGPSTNSVPISSITQTNINGANGFLLVWYAPAGDLFQVQWSPGLGAGWNTFTNIIGYHTFINATNSEFEFFDDGSQTGGFSPFRFYRLILLNGTAPSTNNVIPLTNGVALNYNTAGSGTNFFSFDVTQTNAAVLFELYNLSGNGDLTAQRSNLPVAPPYAGSSTNPGTNYEQIVIRTNGSMPNLNAISWFLGVPNQTAGGITYTIRATVPTNGLLISGLPLNVGAVRSNGANVLTWGPTVLGEKYEVRTNSSLTSTNWGALTDIIATGTSITFTDPNSSTATMFYRIVQVP